MSKKVRQNQKINRQYLAIRLRQFLKHQTSDAKVEVYDTRLSYLNKFLNKKSVKKYFPAFKTYEMKIDVIGFVIKDKGCKIAIANVIQEFIGLEDLSIFFGYCKVLKPKYAFLISPIGPSKEIEDLLFRFHRLDILEFMKNRYIQIVRWDKDVIKKII